MGINFTSITQIASQSAGQITNNAVGQFVAKALSIQHDAGASMKASAPSINHIGMNKNLLAGAASLMSTMNQLKSLMTQVQTAMSSVTSLGSQLSSITSSLSSITSITSSLGSITSLASGLSQFTSLTSSLSGMTSGGSSGGGSVGDLQQSQQTQASAVSQVSGVSQTLSSLSTTALFSGGVSPYADVHTHMSNLAGVLTKAFLLTSTTQMTIAGSGFASGQTVTFTVNDPILGGGTHNITPAYMSAGGDTTASQFAIGIAAAINADTTVNTFLAATPNTPSTGIVTLVSDSGSITTYSASSSGGSETYTDGSPVNVFGSNLAQTTSNNDDAINTVQGVLYAASVLADLGTTMSQPTSTATVLQLKDVMNDINTILTASTFTTAMSTLSAQNSTMANLVVSIKVDVDAVVTALGALP